MASTDCFMECMDECFGEKGNIKRHRLCTEYCEMVCYGFEEEVPPI